MSGVSFGKELKVLRNKVGLSSKVLSQKVGKAVTYVSQLERGLIKNPDYDTCRRILAELGLTNTDGENMLNYFSIKSPELKHAELEWSIRLAEEEELKHESGYYNKKLEKITNKNAQVINLLEKRLGNFVMYDHSRAENVLNNLIKLFEDEELFDYFFCTLFENNYSALSDQERSTALSLVNDYIRNRSNKKFITSLDNKEEKE